jgi:putative ABC transport system ATP-binding protein
MNTAIKNARTAVEMVNLRKSYRSGMLVSPVLHGIDLEIGYDGLSVLSGPSGSGKTTLLNLIGCIDRPDSGSLRVLGCEVGALSDNELSDFRRKKIGFIFQNFNLLPVLTAYENVEYPLLLSGELAGQRRLLVNAALEQVGLEAHMYKLPGQLSGGQRQRVAIARALVKRPSLVLADEPTANLDSENGANIVTLMKSLQAQCQIAFIVCSHDAFVQSQADQVYCMLDGMIVTRKSGPMAYDTSLRAQDQQFAAQAA